MRKPYVPLLLLVAAVAAQAQSISVQLLNMSDTAFGPVLAVTHRGSDAPLFDPAEPPSAGLRQLAAGDHAVLEAQVRDRLGRWSGFGTTAGPRPGQAVTFEVELRNVWRTISLAAWLPGGGFVGASGLYAGRGETRAVDLLAWEAADTILVHRSRPSPIARARVRYVPPPAPDDGLGYLTAAQRQEREACLAESPACIWRLLEGVHGYCSDCLPPLRPNAARTHCIP